MSMSNTFPNILTLNIIFISRSFYMKATIISLTIIQTKFFAENGCGARGGGQVLGAGGECDRATHRPQSSKKCADNHCTDAWKQIDYKRSKVFLKVMNYYMLICEQKQLSSFLNDEKLPKFCITYVFIFFWWILVFLGLKSVDERLSIDPADDDGKNDQSSNDDLTVWLNWYWCRWWARCWRWWLYWLWYIRHEECGHHWWHQYHNGWEMTSWLPLNK